MFKAQKIFLRISFSILVREKGTNNVSLKIHKGCITLSGNISLEKRRGWYLQIQSQTFYTALLRNKTKPLPKCNEL